jgi:branched-chain amino acid aminotransferase
MRGTGPWQKQAKKEGVNMAAQERVVYLNGKIIPESQAAIPIRDKGFIYGDAVFDVARTFNGKIFKGKEHVDRLFTSCKYLRLDPGMNKQQMLELTEEVAERNVPLLRPQEDYWVTQRVTRGADPIYPGDDVTPTVLIECKPLPLALRARLFKDGISMMTPSTPRVPPVYMSPRAKTHNYLNLVLGNLEVHDVDSDGWALMLDDKGNLAEGLGSNVFIVRDGVLQTPKEQFVLSGVTRSTVLDLAASLKIPAEERDIDLFDAYTAEEAFLTSTSLCICPASSLNGSPVGDGKVPGPVTERLMGAFSDLAGMDYVAQYLAHLDA